MSVNDQEWKCSLWFVVYILDRNETLSKVLKDSKRFDFNNILLDRNKKVFDVISYNYWCFTAVKMQTKNDHLHSQSFTKLVYI